MNQNEENIRRIVQQGQNSIDKIRANRPNVYGYAPSSIIPVTIAK